MTPLFALSDTTHPREFTARFGRKSRAIGARRRSMHRGRRLAALAVAVAVPAFASPVEWTGDLAAMANGGTDQAAQAMGFETPGESFPGSAFYYLADETYAPLPITDGNLAPAAHWDNATPEAGSANGQTARPLVANGTETDRNRALHCLTQAIYYEAASESDAGQRAVAQVVLNRVAHPTYPDTVCGVVFQGSARKTGCQFTFTCDGSLARRPSRFSWNRARAVALAALSGAVYAPVGLATHYHTVQIHPYWADSLQTVGTIGAHIFYKWKGAAGRPAAFRSAYLGAEPSTSALARSEVVSKFVPSPAVVAGAYDAGVATEVSRHDYTAQISARVGDTLYSGERLPVSGSIKAEYARSGEWIAKP